jgi:transcriptional regulator with XRE-family HTH domain
MDRVTVTGAPKKSPLRIQIGKAIQRHRRNRGYTQTELAERADLSLKYVGEIERGAANMSIEVIERIAAVLGWNPLEVMGGVRGPLAEGVRTMVVNETEQVRERLGAMVAWLRAIDPTIAKESREQGRRRASRAR